MGMPSKAGVGMVRTCRRDLRSAPEGSGVLRTADDGSYHHGT